MANEKYGKRLKRLRQLAGISQAAVAHHLGFDRCYISLIEAGHRTISQEDMAKAEVFLQEEQDKQARAFASYREASAPA
jgi:transcriptional regulator with XRE-family HTH domain